MKVISLKKNKANQNHRESQKKKKKIAAADFIGLLIRKEGGFCRPMFELVQLV